MAPMKADRARPARSRVVRCIDAGSAAGRQWAGTGRCPRPAPYHQRRWTTPRSRRPARPVPLAPRAGADRHPRRGDLARGARAGRRGDLAREPRLALRRGDGPRLRRGRRATRSSGAATSATTLQPGAAPADPAPLATILDEFTTRIAPHTLNSYHPRALSYFTPPPLVASIAGEVLAQWTNQGIDVWHAGPVGAFVEEEVVRWLTDLVGYGDRRVRPVHVGRRDGELHRDGARPRRPPARGCGRSPRPPRGRDLEGARVYTSDQTHFSIARALDELGFPPETLVVAPGRRTRSASTRSPSPRPSRATGPPGSRRSRSAPSRARPTRARSTGSRSWPRSPSARACGSTSTPRTAAPPGSPPATPIGCRASTSPTRSRSTRTSGSSRPTTWARCSSATATTSARPSTARPSTTAAARARPARTPATPATARARRPRRPAQLLQARVRGHAAVPRAQAVGVVEAPRHDRASAGWSSATTTSPRTWPPGAPRPTTSRPCPPRPSCPSSASGTCPGGAGDGGRDGARGPRRPPGPARGRARGLGRRLAEHDDPARLDVPARRHRELPDDRGGHRPPARHAPVAWLPIRRLRRTIRRQRASVPRPRT